MRNVCNGVIWFTLISGAFFAVASQVEPPDAVPQQFESALGTVDGHPRNCLACKHRGRALPDEIDDKTVWLKQGHDGSSGR